MAPFVEACLQLTGLLDCDSAEDEVDTWLSLQLSPAVEEHLLDKLLTAVAGPVRGRLEALESASGRSRRELLSSMQRPAIQRKVKHVLRSVERHGKDWCPPKKRAPPTAAAGSARVEGKKRAKRG